jgi:hypothetical protein
MVFDVVLSKLLLPWLLLCCIITAFCCCNEVADNATC